jgi:hypothetical protein
VVLGSCGLNNLKEIMKANRLKKEILKQSNPLETSSLFLLKKAVT